MIAIDEVLELHRMSIEAYGGSMGIRDKGALESAVARPYSTYGGEELYPFVYQKSAAIFESIIRNHPFIDGNKRTALLTAYAVARIDGKTINASSDEFYKMEIDCIEQHWDIDAITQWFAEHINPLEFT